jgi:hypothetical protein
MSAATKAQRTIILPGMSMSPVSIVDGKVAYKFKLTFKGVPEEYDYAVAERYIPKAHATKINSAEIELESFRFGELKFNHPGRAVAKMGLNLDADGTGIKDITVTLVCLVDSMDLVTVMTAIAGELDSTFIDLEIVETDVGVQCDILDDEPGAEPDLDDVLGEEQALPDPARV